jgi:hypothetical protein
MTEPAGHVEALATLLGADIVRLRAAAAALQPSDHEFETRTRGPSMAEAMPAGSPIRVRCGTEQGCRVGDVVVFMNGTDLTAHRVAYQGRSRRARGFLVTLGDGLVMPDRPVSVTSIVGRVTAVHGTGGWAAVGASAPPSLTRRCVRRVMVAATIAALEVSPPLARGLGSGVVALWIALSRSLHSCRLLTHAARRRARGLVARRWQRG